MFSFIRWRGEKFVRAYLETRVTDRHHVRVGDHDFRDFGRDGLAITEPPTGARRPIAEMKSKTTIAHGDNDPVGGMVVASFSVPGSLS
jgi:hypothetical protein